MIKRNKQETKWKTEIMRVLVIQRDVIHIMRMRHLKEVSFKGFVRKRVILI